MNYKVKIAVEWQLYRVDPEDFVHPVEATIISDQEEAIGSLKGWLLDLHEAAREPGRGPQTMPWIVMDETDAQLAELHDQMFNGLRLRPEVARLYGHTRLYEPVFYLAEVRLDPEHRGTGAGLDAVSAVLKFFAGKVKLAFCKPGPLADEDATRQEVDPLQWQLASDKLRKHWMQAGFKRLGDGPFMLAVLER